MALLSRCNTSMKFSYTYALYIALALTILVTGLVYPLNSYSPQSTFPFFNWSLFDKAPPVIHDYMARVTCLSDPEVEAYPPIYVLEDNSCLKLSPRVKYRDRNRSFQTLLNNLLANGSRPEKLQRELESFLELRDYEKIVIYKRTYDPKEFYLNKKFKQNEKLVEFKRI